MSPRATSPKKKPTKKKPAPATKTKKSPAPTKKKKPAAPKKKKKSVPQSSGRVHDIISDEDPIAALRWFLDSVPGDLTRKNGLIALSAAQLLVRDNVPEIVDLMLEIWDRLPEPSGFHAQEFLRTALTALDDDDRFGQLLARVPEDPSPELYAAVATAYALIHVPVEVARLVRPVRTAFHRVQATLEEFGEPVVVARPADLSEVLATERAAQLHLPSDYRALLTITDGCTLFDRTFLALADYRVETDLGRRARSFLQSSRIPAQSDCVPVATWGNASAWLVYDVSGAIHGAPCYAIVSDHDEAPCEDLVSVLERLTALARDILATN